MAVRSVSIWPGTFLVQVMHRVADHVEDHVEAEEGLAL